MNKQKFEFLLTECLDRLDKGESLQSILKEYPQQANRLEPLLQAALVVRSTSKPEPSPEAVRLGKNRLLAEVDTLRQENKFSKKKTRWAFIPNSRRWFNNIGDLLAGRENFEMKLFPRLAIYVLVTVLVGGYFTVSASASSLPGDALYGLKLGWEQVQLALTFGDDSQEDLEEEFESERIFEVEDLLEQGREEEIEFFGTIEEKGESAWLISGITVQIGPDTEFEGTLEVGTLVKVEAMTQEDGSLLALEISADMDDGGDDDMDDGDDDDMDGNSDEDDEDDDSDNGSDDDTDDESDDDSDNGSDDDTDDESDDDSDNGSDDDTDDGDDESEESEDD